MEENAEEENATFPEGTPRQSEDLLGRYSSQKSSSIVAFTPSVGSKLDVDFRREWVKERVLSYLGIEDDLFFDEMLAEKDRLLEKKLEIFLDAHEEQLPEEFEHKVFYVYRTWSDRLFEEEIFVQELGELNFLRKFLWIKSRVFLVTKFFGFSCAYASPRT